ncbi:hypothetical protein AWR36_008500 [Microbulbifer flavimaris]|uniref:Uncharacterized protein n=1 Tax=Microbulbifer flavimaris TaxID=1781068 RepID=A0ABX4I0W9_9GAMM|nr:hypothetical protein AVO43_08470 [Microbulbifer sp. ZGT114]PCO06022.1 hypothetical protein AWR36_008500 [Microbulbifer flavimaris]
MGSVLALNITVKRQYTEMPPMAPATAIREPLMFGDYFVMEQAIPRDERLYMKVRTACHLGVKGNSKTLTTASSRAEDIF